ncbi:unnamed protein product [Gadus morhua 'NCC']
MANLNVSVDETDVSPVCIAVNEVRQLINKPVLETFFWVPKINWKKRPTPEGPNEQLSERQYRLVAYRVILEWALKGQPLDEEITLDHPDVWYGVLGMSSHPPLDSMRGLNKNSVLWDVKDEYRNERGNSR